MRWEVFYVNLSFSSFEINWTTFTGDANVVSVVGNRP